MEAKVGMRIFFEYCGFEYEREVPPEGPDVSGCSACDERGVVRDGRGADDDRGYLCAGGTGV